MTVFFIGAGPGAADLLTLRADRLLRRCPVVMYAGSLVPPEVLESISPSAEVINTARMPLDVIFSHMKRAHEEGKDVARLQSGDPAIYSALAEQARQLTAAGIPYEVVPGVSSFSAAAAVLGHELTVPEVGQTIILTRVNGRASQMPAGEDLSTLAQSRSTLCIHLAAHATQHIVKELLPFYGPECPVAVVAYATRPEEKIIRCTLRDLEECIHREGITRTALIIVGPVLNAEGFPDSFLYSPDRPRDHEGRTIPCAP